MSRGGVLLAVVLTLAISPAAAAGQPGAQPDLMLVSRHGSAVTGDNVYNEDGGGQQRSVIVDKRVDLRIRIENDGGNADDFLLFFTVQSRGEDEFRMQYRLGRFEFDIPDPSRQFGTRVIGLEVGSSRDLHILVRAVDNAPLGSKLRFEVGARKPHGAQDLDTVSVEITKTSTPT